jgi:glutamine---fructose-6-phosphate transaminase (isomerizing)
MPAPSSHMLRETNETPEAVGRLLEREKAAFEELGRLFRDLNPAVVTTAARGSSDHAATFFKYLMEIQTGIPVASIGPSVASVYERPLKLRSAIHFTISQSGASPDIVALQDAAKTGGAMTVAVVNVAESPVARNADIVIPLGAGPEQSVAATKSFIASAAALAACVSTIRPDETFANALIKLPQALAATAGIDSREAENALSGARSIFACGRGPSYGIAQEAALKAKETAALHAEAFSLAEVLHGPMRLVGPGFPIVGFVPDDDAFENSVKILAKLADLGARTLTLSSRPVGGEGIIVPTTGNGLLDPLVALVTYYRLVEAITRKKGLDPDKPDHLLKVTETI